MPKITYKDLYTQVDELIKKRIEHRGTTKYQSQLERVSVSPFSIDALSDVSASEMLESIYEILSLALPSYIADGLIVSATSPTTSSVTISAGEGSVGGRYYSLASEVTLPVPFDDSTSIFYIQLHNNTITVDKAEDKQRLKIAKIIVPKPGTTNRVRDQRSNDSPWDAYIQNFTEYPLYGDANGNLEEDSIDLLRDNIVPIMADNIFGNLKLSENLKITNTAGTLELDSKQVLIKDFDENVLAKFNKDGTFFYDAHGSELAKFTVDEARVGNIVLTKNTMESGNFLSGSIGFQIKDDGTVEFQDATIRGTIYAPAGEIGGFTLAENSMYATTTGTIKTGANVGTGYNGVIMDKDGLRVYDDVLGCVVNFPSDGSAPSISSGTIQEVIYEITTNSVMRTAETVGDGGASSAGILINNTGLYGCEANQTLAGANLKVLANGSIYLKGEIVADRGQIGNVTITPTKLSGGLIEGALIRSPIIETSATTPRIKIDDNGVAYEVSAATGKYSTFKYGDGTKYGSGVLAYLMNPVYPVLAVLAEQNLADIRLYNRGADPAAGTHIVGDLIVVGGELKICTTGGTPGTFTVAGASRALDNLASVAINTSLISDTDNTDDLGSDAKEWKDLWLAGKAYITGFGRDMLIDLGIELRFGDTAVKISSETDGHLDVVADVSLDFIIGSTEQFELVDGAILPTTNNDIDLGSDAVEFKDLWIDGTAYLDAVTMHGNLNFNDNQAINFILENRTNDTGMTVTGQMWFRTDV